MFEYVNEVIGRKEHFTCKILEQLHFSWKKAKNTSKAFGFAFLNCLHPLNPATNSPLDNVCIWNGPMMLGRQDSHMQKNEARPLSYIIYTCLIEMD